LEGLKVRRMSRDDLGTVLDIEKTCFSSPWSKSSFEYELTNRDAIMKVAVFEGRVIGFICLRTLLDITHILNLSVTPEFRRRGIGTTLLKNALRELRHKKRAASSVTLEVRESNTAAIRLYEKSGFRLTGRRIRYYQKPVENAVIMDLKGLDREDEIRHV
jgi:ribosomal-protein-alanine N-acetyltransferase